MTMSFAALSSAYAEETGEVWIALVTFLHSGLVDPIRLTSDNLDTTSRTNVFTPAELDVKLSDETGDGPGDARVIVDAVDRSILNAIERLDRREPVRVDIEYVLGSAPDDVIAENLNMTARVFRSPNLMTLEIVLAGAEYLLESVPGILMSKDNVPGIHT